mgnify:CR=1 FL=1
MKKAVCLLAALVLAAVLSGCGLIRIEEEERKPVDYTVVERQDIPAALDEIMNEKKEKEFQLSYETGEALYLAKGYGRQMSGGYSIQVEELGVTSQAVFFKTKLMGPSDSKITLSPPSYPYIVVKMAYRKEPVIFE